MKYPAFINDVPKIKLYSEIVYEDCIAERQLRGFLRHLDNLIECLRWVGSEGL